MRVLQRRSALGWVGAGVLLFLLGVAWSLAVPLMAGPDEPSHVIRAAAVAHGQWSGELGPEPTDGSRPGAGTIVHLPSDYGAAAALPNCFAFRSDVPAACQQDVAPAEGDLVPTETFAGQYPPLYYALVGWPARFLGAEAATYGMRAVGAALVAALVVWAAHRVRRDLGPTVLWGLTVAVTPMVLFMGATVNPQGLEIASALSFWAAVLALVRRPEGPTTAAMVQAAVSGAVLINVRTSSPFWALVVVVVALVVAPSGRVREVLRHRAARWVGAVAALASVLAVAWVALHPAVVTGKGLHPEYRDPRLTVFAVTSKGFEYLTNMIGDFGWLDAPAPPLTVGLWLVVLGGLALPALAMPAARRVSLVLPLTVLLVAAAPYVLTIPTAPDTGVIWQGRYALPIAVGVPLVAGVVLATTPAAAQTWLRRGARWTVVGVLVAQVAAFYWGARRYSEGLLGEVVTLSPDWSSPIGFLPGVALYAVLATALAALCWSSLGSGRPRDDERDTGAVEPAHEAAVR